MDVIKLLLETQNNAFKSSLQIFVEQMDSTMNSFRTDLQELKDNFTFMEQNIKELKDEMKDCKRNCNADRTQVLELQAQLQSSKVSFEALTTRCNNLDDQSRLNNLVVGGIQEDPWETPEHTSTKLYSFLEDKMQMPCVILDEAHRIGKRQDDRPRAVLVRFSRRTDRDAVIRNGKMLEGSRIYVTEDLCPESMQIKKAQLPMLKQAKQEGKIAYFAGTKLVIREKRTYEEHGRVRESWSTSQTRGEGRTTGLATTTHPATPTPTPTTTQDSEQATNQELGGRNVPNRLQLFH